MQRLFRFLQCLLEHQDLAVICNDTYKLLSTVPCVEDREEEHYPGNRGNYCNKAGFATVEAQFSRD